jgi:hypothetical protein
MRRARSSRIGAGAGDLTPRGQLVKLLKQMEDRDGALHQ